MKDIRTSKKKKSKVGIYGGSNDFERAGLQQETRVLMAPDQKNRDILAMRKNFGKEKTTGSQNF